MSQFVNPTHLSLRDDYATIECAVPQPVPQLPPMQTVVYYDSMHLLRLIIASCPKQVAMEATTWVNQVAVDRTVMVMRDYGLTLVPAY